MKKNKKIIILTVFSIILISLIVFFSRKIFSSVGKTENFYSVTKEIFENVIEISGTVEAAQEQILQALSNGTVIQVYVEEGDYVKKGDVIIQLDDTTEQYNLAKQDYNIAATKITGSEREIKLMESERLSLLQKVSDRKVVATFDGLIAQLDVSVGDSLEAKDSVGTLVNVDYLIAEVEIPETDVGKLKIGQKVEFTFSAYKDKIVYGNVIGWPQIGEITSRGATVVKAKIKIEDYPADILPNYSFTGKIQISEPEEFFLVSRNAVASENRKTYVVSKNSSEKRFLKIQPYGSGFVKILEGDVKEGEILKELTPQKTSGAMKQKSNQPGLQGQRKNQNGMPPGMNGGPR